MKYDVLIVGDISSRAMRGYGENLQTDRWDQVSEFIQKGGGLLYTGGEASFQGREQMGGWWISSLKEVLPVEILPVPDDTLYSAEGFKLKILDENHELTKDIPWTTCPLFKGYNIVGDLKKGANLLAKIGYPGEEKDLGLAEWLYGKGRVLTFTSDLVPEWSEDFAKWDYYPQFWIRTIKWLTGRY
jgi:uncharacterized membrane protein